MASAGVSLVGFVMAISLAALQALAAPSGTVVGSLSVVLALAAVGATGAVAFAVLWFTGRRSH